MASTSYAGYASELPARTSTNTTRNESSNISLIVSVTGWWSLSSRAYGWSAAITAWIFSLSSPAFGIELRAWSWRWVWMGTIWGSWSWMAVAGIWVYNTIGYECEVKFMSQLKLKIKN